MICRKCGNEFESKFCPECGTPVQPPVQNVPPITVQTAKQPKTQSALGVVALILCITGCLNLIGLILAIIDLCKKDGKKHTCAAAAIGFFALYTILGFAILMSGTSSEEKETSSTMKTTVEAESLDDTNIDVPVETRDDFISQCSDFDYKTFARNPEEHLGENVKLTVKVFEVCSGGMFSEYEYYYKTFTDDGSGIYMDNMIWVFDAQNPDDSTKILEDDIITIYGTFTGMIETKNNLTGSKGEDIGIEIKYVDLIEE